jgi:hypothetical protein
MFAFVHMYCALRTSSSTFWARMGNSSLVRLFSTYNIMSSAEAGHSSTAGHLLHELHDVALGRLAADLQVALVVVQHGHACSREWGNSTKAHLNHRFAAVVASQTSRDPSPPYCKNTIRTMFSRHSMRRRTGEVGRSHAHDDDGDRMSGRLHDGGLRTHDTIHERAISFEE